MPNRQDWTSRDVRFDEYGRIVMSERFAAAFENAVRRNGKLAVHAPDVDPRAIWNEVNRVCPGGVPPIPPPPINMCDCEFDLSWFNPGRPMPVQPPDPDAPADPAGPA